MIILGKGAHLTAVPIQSPESPVQTYNDMDMNNTPSIVCYKNMNDKEKTAPKNIRLREQDLCNGSSPIKNGCTSNRENLLAKTDVAMASLLVRLDQVAAQCNAAQIHGGGRFMCEDKFQVSYFLQILLFIRIRKVFQGFQ